MDLLVRKDLGGPIHNRARDAGHPGTVEAEGLGHAPWDKAIEEHLLALLRKAWGITASKSMALTFHTNLYHSLLFLAILQTLSPPVSK